MKARLLLLLCSLAAINPSVAVFADTWDSLFAERLDASSTWRDARLKLRQAELNYDQSAKPWLPSLSAGTVGQAGLALQNGEFSGGTIRTDLTLSGLLGTDISLQAPLVIAKDGAFDFPGPSLIASRKLFTESTANRLGLEAALVRARVALRDAEEAVRLQLVTDILNAVYYTRLLDANRLNLEVLDRIKAATHESSQREVERRILQARRGMLVASGSLAALDTDLREKAETLYSDLLSRSTAWTAGLPDNGNASAPATSPTIRAQELDLAAAEKRKAFSLLPWLPNPALSAQVSYDQKQATFNWGLGLQLSVVLLDKGERALNSLQRTENVALARLRLESARKSLGDGVRQARERLEILELDKRIKALDVEDEWDNVTLLKALLAEGFTNEENLVIGQIDLSIAQLEAVKIEHDLLIQRLKLAQYFAAE
jgi:outer membrane protein TolC